jgi:hypothetical protein
MLIDTRQEFCRLQRSQQAKSRALSGPHWQVLASVRLRCARNCPAAAGKSLPRFAAQRGGTFFSYTIPLTAPPRGVVDSMAAGEDIVLPGCVKFRAVGDCPASGRAGVDERFRPRRLSLRVTAPESTMLPTKGRSRHVGHCRSEQFLLRLTTFPMAMCSVGQKNHIRVRLPTHSRRRHKVDIPHHSEALS